MGGGTDLCRLGEAGEAGPVHRLRQLGARLHQFPVGGTIHDSEMQHSPVSRLLSLKYPGEFKIPVNGQGAGRGVE